MVLVKSKGGWVVKTHDRRRTLGTHRSKAKAAAQLRAIEASKARRGR